MFAFAMAQVAGAGELPERIEIHLSHVGLSTSQAESYVVDVRGDSATRGKDTVPVARIRTVVDALSQRPSAAPTLRNFGMRGGWFEAARQRLSRDNRDSSTNKLDDKQEAYFERAFVDTRNAQLWMELVYSGKFISLDDYPHVTVDIHWLDRATVRLESSSASPFMLPWGIGAKAKTFNADVSRAIAALLPNGALNRGRINGESLAPDYADWLLSFELRDRIETIGAADVLGRQLDPIRHRYDIETLSLEPLDSDDLSGKPSVQLHLSSRTMPRNVRINMTLWQKGNRIGRIDVALAAADRAERRALSVPWLSKFLKATPDTVAEVRVVQDRSVSAKLAHELLEDLRAHGKSGLASEIEPLLSRTTFLYLNGPYGAYARWFVLPDLRMLLWNYKTATPLQALIVHAPRWDWYAHVGIGALISPDGKVLEP
jgi:hypothetical protein